MKERPKRLRFMAWLMAVVAIFVAFGAGVVVGKPAPVRKPHASKKRARSFEERVAEGHLEECRKRLSARTQAAAAASAAAAAAEKVKREQPEVMARIEALEDQVEECKRREILTKTDVCTSPNRHYIVLAALLYGSESCVDKAGIGDFIIGNHDMCTGLDDISFDWYPDDYELTEAQRKRVTEAAYQHNRFKRESVKGGLKRLLDACIDKWGEPHE